MVTVVLFVVPLCFLRWFLLRSSGYLCNLRRRDKHCHFWLHEIIK